MNKRLAAARQVAGRLIDCAGEQRFGELLRALQADSDGGRHLLPDRNPLAG